MPIRVIVTTEGNTHKHLFEGEHRGACIKSAIGLLTDETQSRILEIKAEYVKRSESEFPEMYRVRQCPMCKCECE